VEEFTKDLVRREKESRLMNFYCDSLQKWSIEGIRRDERASVENAHKKALALKQAENDRELALRKSLIKNDAYIVEEDEKITQEVLQ